MNVNIYELKERVSDGLIKMIKHPNSNLDLFLYDYADTVQYSAKYKCNICGKIIIETHIPSCCNIQAKYISDLWDTYTRMCRGLILDSNGKILARPFSKFFNINEKSETMIENLPKELPLFYEKLDGSLIIQYYINGIVYGATRGSFDSVQAKFASKWLQDRFKESDFIPGYTYLWECIYPANQIVVDYKGYSGLRLLSVINMEDTSELDFRKEAERLHVDYAKKYTFSTIDEMNEFLETKSGYDFEGFVMKYTNGLRVKYKSKDYKRLHKVLTGLTNWDLWNDLRSNISINKYSRIGLTDEQMEIIKKWKQQYQTEYNEIVKKAIETMMNYYTLKRGEIANKIQNIVYKHVIFALLDYNLCLANNSAWSIIEPKNKIILLKKAKLVDTE